MELKTSLLNASSTQNFQVFNDRIFQVSKFLPSEKKKVSIQNSSNCGSTTSPPKIFSIKEKRSGVISSASLDGVPNERDLLGLTAETTDLFVTSIKKNNFEKLYKASSRKMQNEFSQEQLEQSFQSFLKLGQDTQALNYLNSLKTYTPSYVEKPFINEQNLLMLKGKYSIKPPFTFTYIYIFEGLSWKLSGINAKI